MTRMLRWMLAPLAWLLRWSIALVILFEEWGWEPLARALERLRRLPLVRRVEAAIVALPPYGALAVFCVPTLLLVPVKLLALWLIGQGHAGLGVTVIVLAKLVGTALLARLFTLTQAQLMQIAWFARLYGRWSAFKADVLRQVRASAAWRAAQEVKAAAQAFVRGLRG